MTPAVYLDYNATAPTRPEVAAAMAACLAEPGNPSSVHAFGRAARRRLEEARAAVAELVAAAPAGVVFTSGGTEANNLALRGTGRTRILVSAVEHGSVIAAAPAAELISVDAAGRVRLDALEEMLAADHRPALVSIMLANNETGVVQPVAEAAAIARRHGALVHCDAVQGPGRLEVDIGAMGVDLLTLSAHKLGGPAGVGALVLAEDGLDLAPLLRGGGQERGRRSGTENLPGIVGFGAAARAAAGDDRARLRALRERLEAEALRRVPRARVVAAEAERLPNTVCLALPGLASDIQVMALDLEGIAVSAGAACSSGKVAASHVLAAMGLPAATAGSAIRVSLGWGSREEDVARFVEAWAALAARGPHADSERESTA